MFCEAPGCIYENYAVDEGYDYGYGRTGYSNPINIFTNLGVSTFKLIGGQVFDISKHYDLLTTEHKSYKTENPSRFYSSYNSPAFSKYKIYDISHATLLSYGFVFYPRTVIPIPRYDSIPSAYPLEVIEAPSSQSSYKDIHRLSSEFPTYLNFLFIDYALNFIQYRYKDNIYRYNTSNSIKFTEQSEAHIKRGEALEGYNCESDTCDVSSYLASINPTTLLQNSLSIPRKIFLENHSNDSIRVELTERDFNFTTRFATLSWSTYRIIPTTISSWSTASIYQTREDYMGPIYCKIFNTTNNALLLDSVIRGYPLEVEDNLTKLNWKQRLTTTQVKSIYYPYEYGYYITYPQ